MFSLRSGGHDVAVNPLVAAGLGLADGTIRFDRTTQQWLEAGSRLRDDVRRSLGPLVEDVEQIGSSAVLGLVAKPIVDLAAAMAAGRDVTVIVDEMGSTGWIYRGDAGDDGGHVFLLEALPRLRVAHLHIVDQGDAQWRTWLRFRDLLRSSREARERYGSVKLHLAEQHASDRAAYTDGKTEIVGGLLAELG